VFDIAGRQRRGSGDQADEQNYCRSDACSHDSLGNTSGYGERD
jgi:hypothetical protein